MIQLRLLKQLKIFSKIIFTSKTFAHTMKVMLEKVQNSCTRYFEKMFFCDMYCEFYQNTESTV